jgi:hypothetical protein
MRLAGHGGNFLLTVAPIGVNARDFLRQTVEFTVPDPQGGSLGLNERSDRCSSMQ